MPIEDLSKIDESRRVTEDVEEIFSQYDVASWKVGNSDRLAFPVLSIQETGGNRLVERERPYRDGAKLDDTGSKAKRWSITCLFNNTLQSGPTAEGGIAEINGDKNLYPDVLNLVIQSFDEHETGDLSVPTRGLVRARAENYTRTESESERDQAMVTFNFIEDNEDNVNAASFVTPSVTANAEQLAETTFDAETSQGMWDGSVQDLNELSADLEGLANAPGDFAQDLETQAKTVMEAHDRVVSSWTKNRTIGHEPLSDSDSTTAQRKLGQQKEQAGRIRNEARKGRSRLVTVKFKNNQSIFAVAVIVEQDVMELIKANPALENLFFIPAGTPVRILEDATTA